MDKEMEVLLSEKEIKVGDKKVVVKKISMLNTIRLMARLSEIVGIMLNSSDSVANAVAKLTYQGDKDIEGETDNDINGIRIAGLIEIFGLLGNDGTELLKDVIAKSTNLEDEEIEEIDSVEGIDLVVAIYEVNRSFFVKSMNKLKEKMAKIIQKDEKEE